MERLALPPGAAKSLQAELQSVEQIADARRLLERCRAPAKAGRAPLAAAV
jgi:hypothetical protein